MTFTTLLLSSFFANATTVLVVTDQPKAEKAQEVASLFRTTPPFSMMKSLNIKVISTSPTKLGCQTAAPSADDFVVSETNSDFASEETSERLARSEWRDQSSQALSAAQIPPSCHRKEAPITRLISCDTPQSRRYIAALTAQEKARYALIVKTESRYGGSGGKVPVITTGSPASMAIHELMHQLGFADEYPYSNACEADIYCDSSNGDFKSPSGYGALPGTSFNVAAFNAKSNYASSAEARKAHASRIPWLSQIPSSTELIHGHQLGTSPLKGGVALYSSNICEKATARLQTWQPTTDVTIMKTLSTTHIPKAYWPTIAKSLKTSLSP